MPTAKGSVQGGAKLPKPKSGLRAPLSQPDFEASVPVTDWKAKQFLEAKNGLKFKSAEQLYRFEGKQGMMSYLKKALENAHKRNSDLTDLPGDPQELTVNLAEKARAMKTLDNNLITCQKSNYTEHKKQLEVMKQEIDMLQVTYDEIYEALVYTSTQSISSNRSAYQKEKWQAQRKTQMFLKTGGFGEGLAKVFGARIHSFEGVGGADMANWTNALGSGVQVRPSVEKFDLSAPAYFFDTDDGACAVTTWWKSAEETIQCKIVRLADTMAENPRWVGSQGVVDFSVVPKDLGDIFEDGASSADGARVNAICLKVNHKRRGAHQVPFEGLSCLFHGSCEAVVWILAVPIEKTLALPPSLQTNIRNSIECPFDFHPFLIWVTIIFFIWGFHVLCDHLHMCAFFKCSLLATHFNRYCNVVLFHGV